MYNICSTQIPESIKASAGQSSIADFQSSPSISFPVPAMRPKLRKETDFKGVLWMAKRNFPLSATCSSEFHDYISSASRVSYKGACYDINIGIAHQLGSVGMSKATQLISDLRDDGIKISIAGDLWSYNGMAIYGICGHGITRNWEMKIVVLAASCGHERHTGEYMLTLLARVGIESTSDSVFKRVCDNGSNMVLAWDKDGAIPCIDHTLELSVKKFPDELETTLCKVGGLVGHFNHSTIAKNTLADIQKEMNKPQHVLDQDVKTRWRSTFKSCKVLHENQAPVMLNDVRNGRNAGDTYKSNKLNVDEWTEVEEIAGCLQVAADASQMMEGGKYPTSSLVLPCIAKVIESVDPATKILVPERTVDGHVTVPTNSFQETVMCGRAAMLKDLTKRWILELEADLLDFYFIATILDPRFKDFKIPAIKEF